MAMRVNAQLIGIDVSKDELVISLDGDKPFAIPNSQKEIKRWLRQLAGLVEIAIEATNIFHMPVVELAHQLGHKVYLIDAFRLNRYRQGIGGRAKTDITDALLLVRYLKNEHDELRPWEPPSGEYRQMQVLLGRRATLIQAKVRIEQSLKGIRELQANLKSMLKQISRTELLIQKKIKQLVQQSNWQDHVKRCQAIEGIGPLTSAALVMTYHRGQFRSSDAFIAFLGLDVRVRDSGKKKGKRCLTKQGNSELRRLLYLAAMQAKRQPAWQGYYQRYTDRGLSAIQALNILARKLARVAFALMRTQADYLPAKACM